MMKLLLGGSPCTHWSIAQTKNRETEPEGLGWELFKNYLIALEKFKPDYFLYENNKSMSPAIKAQITKELGVEPILINSALMSAQNRQRLYWTNIPRVEQPKNRGVLLRDILEPTVCENGYALKVPGKPLSEREMEYMVRETKDGRNHFDFDYHHDATKEKSSCVTANTHRGVPYNVCVEAIMVAEPLNPLNNGKSRAVTANYHKKSCSPASLSLDAFSDRPEKQIFDFVAEPVSCVFPRRQSRDLTGEGWGYGAKTGLYAAPLKEEKVGVFPNGAGELTQCQSKRIYSVDAKGRVLNAGPGGLGVQTGLYAVPTGYFYTPIEANYDVIGGAEILIANGKIRQGDAKGSKQGKYVYTELADKSNAILAGQAHNEKVLTLAPDGNWKNVYEVCDGQITIKDKQYPIKLADGFYIIRKLTVTECKRLQTVPESYVFPVSDTQAYKMLGNGWTVDVIAHILHYAPGIATEPLEVLSMYDGMSCGHLALDKLGANVARYYATEIDKYAIKTTQHNYPDTIQMGDAFQVREDGWTL